MNLQLIIAAVIAAASFGTAWTARGWVCDADAAKKIAADAVALEAGRAKANTAGTGHEADKLKLQTKFVTITETVEKIIEKPIYRADCFDADGMRAHASAVKLTDPASQPSDPVPAAAPAQ